MDKLSACIRYSFTDAAKFGWIVKYNKCKNMYDIWDEWHAVETYCLICRKRG